MHNVLKYLLNMTIDLKNKISKHKEKESTENSSHIISFCYKILRL